MLILDPDSPFLDLLGWFLKICGAPITVPGRPYAWCFAA